MIEKQVSCTTELSKAKNDHFDAMVYAVQSLNYINLDPPPPKPFATCALLDPQRTDLHIKALDKYIKTMEEAMINVRLRARRTLELESDLTVCESMISDVNIIDGTALLPEYHFCERHNSTQPCHQIFISQNESTIHAELVEIIPETKTRASLTILRWLKHAYYRPPEGPGYLKAILP